ncbi:MAG TPA: pitrilysin family protein [Alcanivoracaceae bacterium]|nr:pitrilysin family protein [Alcanivoracaceae bacterium]
MLRTLMLLSLLTSLLLSTPTFASPNTHSYELDNGLQVLVREDHRAPVITVMVWYRVGSIDEPAGMTGISHMLEHMLFKHTKHMSPGDFAEIVARHGGRMNAFTSYEYTGYYQEYEASRLPLALELEAERMQHLQLDADEFHREAKVVHEERRQRTDDNPNALAWEKFGAILRPGTGYAHPVIGWERDIVAYQPSQAQDWYHRWYSPNNAVVVVAGDVDPAEVNQLMQRYYADIPARTVPHRPAPRLAPAAGERRLRLSLPVQVPSLYIGWNVPSINTADNDKDFYALMMLAGVLDGGQSARIERNIIREQRLAAGASVGYQGLAREDGVFIMSASANPNVPLARIEEQLLAEINTLASTPPSQEELQRVRAQVLASNVYKQDSVFGQAMELGAYAMANVPWQLSEALPEKLATITPEDVSAAAKKWLIPERSATAYVEPLTQQEEK